jgi:hypothetical protein
MDKNKCPKMKSQKTFGKKIIIKNAKTVRP